MASRTTKVFALVVAAGVMGAACRMADADAPGVREPAPLASEAEPSIDAAGVTHEMVLTVPAREPMHWVDGHIEARGARYSARVGAAGLVDFRALPRKLDPGAAAVFSIRTESIERGSSPFVRGATRLGAGGAAEISWGPLTEELEARDTDLEQRWRIPRRPDGSGPLRLRLSVAGAQNARPNGDGLLIKHKDSEARIRYGAPTLIDARGAETRFKARWVRGHIELDVPEAVLDATAYPAVLDPAVSVEVAPDDPVQLPVYEPANSIATNGTEFLGVWVANGLIWATRADSTGAPVPNGSVSIAPILSTCNYSGGYAAPRVVFDGTNYVVAWQDQGAILVSRLSPAGKLVDATPLAVATTAAACTGPAVASASGGRTLVTWNDARIVNQMKVYGAFIDTVGKVGAGFLVGASPYPSNPSAACDPGANGICLVSDQSKTYKIGAVGPATEVPGVAGELAFDGTNFLAAGGYLSQVGTVVSRAGVVGATRTYATQPTDLYYTRHTLTPRLGGGFLLLATRGFGGCCCDGCGPDPLGSTYLLLDSNGAPLGATRDLVAQTGTLGLAAVELGGKFGVAIAATGVGMGILRLDSATGNLLDATTNVASLANAQAVVAAGAHATGFLVAWSDARGGTYANRLLPDLAVPNRASFALPSSPAIMPAPNGLRAFYAGSSLSSQSLSAADLGAVVSAQLNTSGRLPQLVWDGVQYLAVWEVGATIYASRVGADGVAIDKTPLKVSVSSRQSNPVVAADGTQFLVVWERNEVGFEDVVGARVRVENGALVADPEIFISGPLSGRQFSPRVVWDGLSFLVVWQDTRNAVVGNIMAARVLPDGTLPNVPVALGPDGLKEAPRLAYTGDGQTNFLAFRSVTPTGAASLRGAWIQRGTTTVLQEMLIAPEGANVLLAPRGEGSVLVAYDRLDDSPGFGARRARVRLATAGATAGKTCAVDGDCLSGHCADGTCCATACKGACETCSATPGTCTPVVSADDISECTGANTCDAKGACKKKVAAACAADAECASGFCADGFCCNARCGEGCDTCAATPGTCTIAAAGTPGAAPACAPFACDGERAACPTGCKKDRDCAAGYSCQVDTGKCVVAARCLDETTLLSPTGETIRCEGNLACRAGACLNRCVSVRDCAPGFFCNAAGTCAAQSLAIAPEQSEGAVAQPSSGCATSGSGGPQGGGAMAVMLGMALASILGRRRRGG
jgi:hypothetical protein